MFDIVNKIGMPICCRFNMLNYLIRDLKTRKTFK